MSNLRGFGYYNHDIGLLKEAPIIGEHLRIQFRAEFFNIWNWHSFENNFTNDVSNASFGVWSGSVSNPRNIQFGAKLIF